MLDVQLIRVYWVDEHNRATKGEPYHIDPLVGLAEI